ncbi:carbamoyltransferase N-terminal domain-containing protein [uncultured Kordia sp.]|uniref:carbamoyltransferase N-terminal domain-containing protein n=1 Tax=uncultured Kordia sp. TaxID=507699 RepID=UPI00262A33F8|nr:carbamoyltransferase N-terminal domain-containing protein [uncultured Kordia sp.]
MIFCGIKITHDGGIALIENNELIFSIELEKVNNNNRYAGITDLSEIEELLQSKGYAIDQIDHFIIDGWHIDRTQNTKPEHSVIETQSSGKPISLPVATYNEESLKEDNLKATIFPNGLPVNNKNYTYSSYKHVAGHILSAYCASPFAAKKEDSYVLVWDGGQYPRLYYVNANTKKVENKGTLFFLTGTIYGIMGHYFGPYKKSEEERLEDQRQMTLNGFFGGLSIAGKIMSYMGEGQINQELLNALPRLYKTTLEISLFFEHKFCAAIKEFTKHMSCTDADVLLTIHTFLEHMIIEKLAGKLKKDAYAKANLCFAGGSALNIKWNSAIRATNLFNDVFVPPFPNDSGSAIGMACAGMWEHTTHSHIEWHPYLGPDIKESEVPEGWTETACNLEDLAALLHHKNEPVVFLSGCAEIGPRALGNRSLIAAATSPNMKACLNMVKKREPFRPVAPICLSEDAETVFDPGCEDPYMLFNHDVREDWKNKVPTICHVDGSARLQTVGPDCASKEIRSLLEAYKKISGIPLLCNTSANYNGKGFFADVKTACEWGKLNYVWNNNILYTKIQHPNIFRIDEVLENSNS